MQVHGEYRRRSPGPGRRANADMTPGGGEPVSLDRSPTVRRRRLGMELRNLREGSGYTIDEVAAHLECSGSKLSRLETGKGLPRLRDVRDLLDLYQVVDERQRELMLTMVRESKNKGWWTNYEDVLPAAFETYVGLEEEAASIRAFQHHVLGLLQTEDYARAMLRAGHVADGLDGVDRLVGGPKVMLEQLHYLAEVAALPNVTLQVLPFEKGAHPGVAGAFSLIEFPEATVNDVVYVDGPAGNIYLEKPLEVRRYTLIFDHLRAAALPPDDSVE